MEQRIEFSLKAMGRLKFRALCQEYGIRAKTGYKWKARFLREGMEGMGEESRRPKSSPEQVAEREVWEIIRLKMAHVGWGPRKIGELYRRRPGEAASESRFKGVLERAGLRQKRGKRHSREAGRLCRGRGATAPNEIWRVDFKGWWRSQGKRCEALTVRDEYSAAMCSKWVRGRMPGARRCAKVLSDFLRGKCTRRVNARGSINMDGQSLFLSTALANWSVGLKPIEAELREVWFGRLLLGQVDLTTSSFIRADKV